MWRPAWPAASAQLIPASPAAAGADDFDQVTLTEANSGVEYLNRAHGQPKPDDHLPSTATLAAR